nr:hypothetical protein BaRGS_024038 [Batillaria attramentaria]
MCPTHEDERLRFLCLQCDTVICRDCKLTKHDGHSSEDLFEAAARCKASLETSQSRLEECIRVVEDKLKEIQEDQAAAQEKREVIEKEIELRYTALVASAKKWRDRVKEELKTESEKADKELAKTTQKVQKELDTLLDLHQRAQNAQEGHPADVVEIEREMEVSSRSEEELAKVQESLPTSTLRLKLERGFLFVMLNDQKEEREAREDDKPVLCAGPRGGIVRIFYYGHSDPIATYTPPQPTSLLTDVCFCHVDGQEKLLVSDWMNDAIHVVSVPKAWMEEGLKLSDVKDADLKFERYLASGSGKIVRPTALNTDTDGNVLIGCGNGWVLRCIMG